MANTKFTVSKNGDTFTWSPTICNNGPDPCFGVKGTVIIPTGIEIQSVDTMSVGQYNFIDNIWQIGTLEGSVNSPNCKPIAITFKEIDVTLGDFFISMVVSSSCNEDQSDNVTGIDVEVTTEDCPIDLEIGPKPGIQICLK